MKFNPFQSALLEALDLDPNKVSVDGFMAEFTLENVVQVTWQGVAQLTINQWDEIMSKAHHEVQ